jgi:hypothetical protein
MENGEFKLYPLILGHKLSHIYIFAHSKTWVLWLCTHYIPNFNKNVFEFLKKFQNVVLKYAIIN